ncbi:hypothetical protein [Halodesulfovibrio spirochaetisodalis]|uniref:Uncharacterized protein n=1 Tax=Halodesulfovibrio spirochaetisodalis TaxID=1560234 RepID=A0A1B7XA79_9BACT|nr:hypothetical protein [Halodesulfovibrio spirochaetisodalis]OBQ46242.1 hypothetical protein SP90_13680 [Halodesulfovibrio spirochaetisodalis]
MQIRQRPLPTEVIPKNTWIIIQQPTKQIRAITCEESEIIDGKHVVKANGYGFSGKEIPVSKIVKRTKLAERKEDHAN